MDLTVLSVLGSGSFGRALLVQSKNDQVKWVMKEIRLPKDQRGMERVRLEALLLSRMKHPNIVTFTKSFEDDGHLYIVMEFCSGGDLLKRIQQQKGSLFTVDMILHWFGQMCLGTKHIHDKRVLHRDLKSKNIFLTNHGIAKIGDFGSACSLRAKDYAQTYVGTPYYVSPEIWDNQPYNNKSDVWSLGCVLYELCTLQHPFQARSWKSLILKVCRGAYTPLPQHFPYELHYLIKHMFKTNPRDRPSISTILQSHRVSRLLLKHLPEESNKLAEESVNHWRKEEGEKVAMFLGQKSLLTTSTPKGEFSGELSPPESQSGNVGQRKRWAQGPPSTVLMVLGNADVTSSVTMGTTEAPDFRTEEMCMGKKKKRERKQWDKDPPERLLSLLEKAPLSTAFRTYTVHRHNADPLLGPLAAQQNDEADGPEELQVDYSRLEPRSDDEDTDFEEDAPFDWIEELEKMVEVH